MDKIHCFVDKWKNLIEVVYYFFLIFGVVIAYFQLRAHTIAQQALRSPLLYIHCPPNADPINGLVIKNGGDVIAININIYVSERMSKFSRMILSLSNKKAPTSKKNIPLLEIGQEDKIFREDSNLNLNDFTKIIVEVTYNSPFHHRKMKIENQFKR